MKTARRNKLSNERTKERTKWQGMKENSNYLLDGGFFAILVTQQPGMLEKRSIGHHGQNGVTPNGWT